MRSRTRSPVPSGEASSMTSTSASGAASWTSSTSGRMLLASLYVGMQTSGRAIRAGPGVLGVGGGDELLGEYYVIADGKHLLGRGRVGLHTVPGSRRNIGNIVIETSGLGLDPATLVGFENHRGKTYLGTGLQP